MKQTNDERTYRCTHCKKVKRCVAPLDEFGYKERYIMCDEKECQELSVVMEWIDEEA